MLSKITGFSRLVILAILMVVSLIGFSLFTAQNLNHIEHNVTQNAINSAKDMINQYKILRGYYTKNIVKKVKANSDLEISFDHHDNPNAIPLPASMIHDLSAAIAKDKKSNFAIKLYSKFPFPNRADRNKDLDNFSKKAMKQIQTNPDKAFYQTEYNDNGKEIIRLAIADKMVAQACVNCHNSHPQTPKSDWKLGDVRGVLEATVPLGEAHQTIKATSKKMLWGLMTIFCLIVLILIFLLLMMTNEKDKIKEIVETSNKLNTYSQALTDSGNELRKNSTHNSEQAQQVSEAVSDVSENVSTISTSTQQLETSVSEIAQSISQVVIVVEEAINHMETSRSQASSLKENSLEINQIVQNIKSIAEQTNMLSLNATIEAARAGEMGRGFSIVAAEVKELSKSTSQLTQQIEDIIKQLQNNTQETLTSIESIDQIVQKIYDIQSVISAAIEEQLIVLKDINNHTTLVVEKNDNVHQRIQSVTRNTISTMAVSEETNQAAQELKKLSLNLQELVNQIHETA